MGSLAALLLLLLLLLLTTGAGAHEFDVGDMQGCGKSYAGSRYMGGVAQASPSADVALAADGKTVTVTLQSKRKLIAWI